MIGVESYIITEKNKGVAVKWVVKIKKKQLRSLDKLPNKVVDKFVLLAKELEKGPEQANWPNYSKLGESTYHCHLNYRYVACWKADKGTITIEVYYVGSRENAPY